MKSPENPEWTGFREILDSWTGGSLKEDKQKLTHMPGEWCTPPLWE
jgi:hypothetical protein